MFSAEEQQQIREARNLSKYVTTAFRNVLKKRLEDYLKYNRVDYIGVDDFVGYINFHQKLLNKPPLDTRGFTSKVYFHVLKDVCHVDSNGLVRRAGSGTKQQEALKARPESLERQPCLHVPTQIHSDPAPIPAIPKSLSIAEVQTILDDFCFKIAPRELSVDIFLQEFEVFNKEAYERFRRMKPNQDAVTSFLIVSVSRCKTHIMLLENGDLSISRLYREGNAPLPDQYQYLDEFPFSTAFKCKMLKADICVEVTDVWVIPRNPEITFVVLDAEASEAMSKKLQAVMGRSNVSKLVELYSGMPCCLPFEGVSDYQRGVVMTSSTEQYAEVFYVDLGIFKRVAKPCIRRLDEAFLDEPIQSYRAVIANSPPWSERRFLKKKISGTHPTLVIKSYDADSRRHVALLEIDSGHASENDFHH